ALPMDAVDPLDRGARRERGRSRGGPRARELLAGAGQDDDAVLTVGADVVEGLGQFAVRQEAPSQRLAFGVQSHLKNAVAALHSSRFVLGGIFLERAHFLPPEGGHYRFRNLSSVTISAACRGFSAASGEAVIFAGNAGASDGPVAGTSNCRAKLTDGSTKLATAAKGMVNCSGRF